MKIIYTLWLVGHLIIQNPIELPSPQPQPELLQAVDLRELDLSDYPGLDGLEPYIIKAQENYNINGVFLLAIIRLESSNGLSNIARTHNNLGGIKWGGRYAHFESRAQCVDYMARLLKNQYLDPQGKFFSGYTLEEIGSVYCPPNSKWPNLVREIMEGIYGTLEY